MRDVTQQLAPDEHSNAVLFAAGVLARVSPLLLLRDYDLLECTVRR